MPEGAQDAFARFLLDLAGDAEVYQLTPEEEADLDAADEEIARGDCASDEELRSVLDKYRS